MILGSNFVHDFSERPTGSFDPARERLRAQGAYPKQAPISGYALT